MNNTNAVAVTRIDRNEMMALLQQSGMAQQSSSNFRRMKVEGGMLVTLDAQGEIENQYPPKFKGKDPLPALTVRIVEPPVYYNAIWLDADESRGGFDANRIGHPELNKSFAKRYDDPAEQAKDHSPANQYYDQIVEESGNRGRFQGDLKVQIVPESGEMTGHEQVYTLTLSPSAALDWRGTRKNPEGGTVQDKNFIVQLADFAVDAAIEAGVTDNAGMQKYILDAMTALRLGGVVADVYVLRAQNQDGTNVWQIPAFKPVHVEWPTSAAALNAPVTGSEDRGDDIGF